MKQISLALFLMAFTQLVMAFSYTVEITEKELQDKVSAMMPLEKKKYFVTVILSNPVVELVNGNNEIGVFSHIQVQAPGGLRGTGKAKISGSLSYDSQKSAFFFKDPKIVSLEVNEIPEKYMPQIKSIAQQAATKLLKTRPVYTLKDDNLKHKLAKSLLKSINIENRKLLIELNAF